MSSWSGRAYPLGSLGLLLSGLLACSLVGCRTKPPAPANVPGLISIAFPTNVAPCLLFLGIEKGYFARGGAQIRALPFESGRDALDRMLAGDADVAAVAETPIAKALLGEGKLKILATINQSGRDVALVARQDKGIHTPGDLRGKAIGFARGTSGHFFLDTYLLVNRIGLDEVRLVDLTPLEMRQALVAGRIDAVSTWEPHVAFLENALGGRAIVLRDEAIYTQTFCVVARTDFVQRNPGQVKIILEGLFRAMAFLSQSPKEATAIVASYAKVDPLLITQSIDKHEFDVRLDQSLVLALQNECRWFMDSGVMARREMPDVMGSFYLDGLLAIRPQAVQVIRTDGGGLR